MYRDPLRAILQTVLERNELADTDNFFSLGGDSIGALEVARQVEDTLGIRLEVVAIYQHPSIEALDRFLEAHGDAAPGHRVTAAAPRTSYPLSPVQRGLYLLDRMTRREDISIAPVVLWFDAALDPVRCAAAFRRVLDRHEILRTTFHWVAGAPVQVIHALDAIALPYEYRALAPGAAALQELYDLAARDVFDLETGPLLRFRVARVSEDLSVALLTIHHIISDGFSASVIEQDFRAFYEQPAAPAPAPLSFQYKDYACWLEAWTESAEGRRALDDWATRLAGCAGPLLPPASTSSFGAARQDLRIDGATLTRIRRISAERQVTLFVALQVFLRILLRLHAGERDLVIGAATTTRDAVPAVGQVGPYLNTLPIRAVLADDSTLHRLIEEVNAVTLAAFAHKLMPLETLADRLHGGLPFFDVGFTLENQDVKQSAARDGRGLITLDARPDSLGVKLLFVAFEKDGGIELQLRFRTECFTHDEILEMQRELVRVIDRVCDRPDAPLHDLLELDPAPAEERFAVELDLSTSEPPVVS